MHVGLPKCNTQHSMLPYDSLWTDYLMLSRAAVHNDAGILNQTEHSKSAKITRYLHIN